MVEINQSRISPHCSRILSAIHEEFMDGIVETVAICERHGEVYLVPFYKVFRRSNQPDQTINQLACPECLVALFNEPKSVVAIEHCETCGVQDNLETCSDCGKVVCAKHRVVTLCDDCAESETNGSGFLAG